MENFIAYNPTQLHFGKDVVDDLAETIAEYGKRVLFVYGKGSIKKYGIYHDIIEQLIFNNSKIYEFALREACTGYCYDNSIFSLFFTRNRLLKIWNLYPDFRSAILENVIMRPFSWKNSLSKEESDLLAANCKTICKKIEEDMEGNLSPEWAMTQDRLEDLGYISVERDFTGNLEKLSDNQTGDA